MGNFSFQENLGCANPSVSNSPFREQILRDLRVLYEGLLHPQTMMDFGNKGKRECAFSAASRLLDCKQFLKNYEPESTISLENPSAIYIFCQVELPERQSEVNAVKPPPELVALSPSATISDLKREASKAFQEVYVIFKGFQAEELVDYRGVEDSTQVKLLFPFFVTLRLQGRCPLKNGLGRFCLERGIERWTVDCSCGARDDDGERMVSCDICEVWQHTRCSGIEDTETVPPLFVCKKCCSSLMPPRAETISFSGNEICQDLLIMPQESEFEDSWMEFTY